MVLNLECKRDKTQIKVSGPGTSNIPHLDASEQELSLFTFCSRWTSKKLAHFFLQPSWRWTSCGDPSFIFTPKKFDYHWQSATNSTIVPYLAINVSETQKNAHFMAKDVRIPDLQCILKKCPPFYPKFIIFLTLFPLSSVLIACPLSQTNKMLWSKRGFRTRSG